MKNLGVRILGLGITNKTDVALLREIVTTSNTDYFGVDEFSMLGDQLQNITQAVGAT